MELSGPVTVVVANKKGGVGKTSVALCLACAWVAQGKHVRLLDLDKDQYDASLLIRAQEPSSVAAAIRTETVIDPAHDEIVVVDAPPRIGDISLRALQSADLIVIPTGVFGIEISVTASFLLTVRSHQPSTALVRIVPTRIEPQSRAFRAFTGEADQLLSIPVTKASFTKRVQFAMASTSPTFWEHLHEATRSESLELANELWHDFYEHAS